MSRAGQPVHWLQVNVALERHDGTALPSARALFGRLSPALADWRGRQLLDHFFFMRKPPDVRLRFSGPDPNEALLPVLIALLSGLRQEGFVRRFFPSVYEPEIRQFGGPEAMGHVHAYFDADSMAWLALDRLTAAGRRKLSPEVLAAAVLNDLFLRALGCPFEVWDVWCNLASLVPVPSGEESQAADVVSVESLFPHVGEEEAQVLRTYLQANEELSGGLMQVWEQGALQCGLRALFPFVALFHFNRHGIGAEQAALIGAMCRAWDAKRGMRGVEVGPPRRPVRGEGDTRRGE
jgi:thiopeptide-type bacteriocin biosynthesis protein